MSLRRSLFGWATGSAAIALCTAAHAAPFKDQLVQAPSIGEPQRGSIAGTLSKLAFGAASLSRGAYSLPIPIDAPDTRGPLLASVLPSYSAESGTSEWGIGWQSDLVIRRHRLRGEIDFTDDDSFVSPWGRLVAGDDGAWYPAGMRTAIRLTKDASGWQGVDGQGTHWFFDASDASITVDGEYSWNLSRVETLFGDSTTLHWTRNPSGRAFLADVEWGGRFDGQAYRMTLDYEDVDAPYETFISGQKALLDRRVQRVISSVRDAGGTYIERWRHDLAYQTSPTGPAFYLTSVTKTFASGASEPPVTYTYDFSEDLLTDSMFEQEPSLHEVLATYGAAALQPDQSSMTDLERNGLTDIEVRLDQTTARQSETGYVLEALPAPTGAEEVLCRPSPSSFNKPRMLARLHGDSDEPNVVVTLPSGAGQTRLVVCDRAGVPAFDQWVTGGWALGPNTRLADIDVDQRADVVRVYAGGVQVLHNTSTSPSDIAFEPAAASALTPVVAPTASWILDTNGDGRPDLMTRHNGGVLVWRGIGGSRFEAVGSSYLFTTAAGMPFPNLATYEMSHGDFNNDGLSDVVLSKGQVMLLFTNRGTGFVHTPVAALSGVPWTVSFPVVADVSGTGNEQVVLTDGGEAQVLQLTRPSTGLLVSSNDGKGTTVQFGYGRVEPVPGMNRLHSILTSMTMSSSGYDPVTYSYDYADPVWHSVGKFMVGFGQAGKASPFLHEAVSFYNDDDIAGASVGTLDEDGRMPGILRFSSKETEIATFHGVPWLRMLAEERGWQSADGSVRIAERTDYLSYDTAGLCPLVTEKSGAYGVSRQEVTLDYPAALDSELSCTRRTLRTTGTHADPSLDFDYRIDFVRDDLGAPLRAEQLGPDGAQVLQELTYDANHRIVTISAPSKGTSTLAYDDEGQLQAVTAPDGVAQTVLQRDQATDALVHTRLSRGTASLDSFADYDALERLHARWDDLSGTSANLPAIELSYQWATGDSPGHILEKRLVDASSGAMVQTVQIMAADGEVLATAGWQPAGWSVSGLKRDKRTSLEAEQLLRAPLASVAGLDYAALYGGATLVGVASATGTGQPHASWSQVQQGVQSTSASARALVGDQLVETVTAADGSSTQSAQGADGKARWFQDQDGVATFFTYDAMGRLRRLHGPQGEHRLDFDGYGRAASAERVGLQRIEWSYDPLTGLETARRDRAGDGTLERTIEHQYDAIGRVVTVIETKGSETRTVSTAWDGQVPGEPPIPGQVGMATTVTTDELTRVSTYRPDGLVTSSTLDLDGWRRVNQGTQYHANGAVRSSITEVLDVNGVTLTQREKAFDYDDYGRLAVLSVDGVPLFTVDYDGEGRPAEVHFADGDLVMSFDAVTRARRGYAMTGATSGSVGWSHNARNQTAQETFSLGGETRVRDYGYDARGFLVSSNDASDEASYAYDSAGLLTSVDDLTGDRPITRGAASIAAGDATYQLDGLGRVVARDDLSVAYGPSGAIEHATRNGAVLRFAYDEAGQRILKYRNGVPVAAYLGSAYLDEDTLVEPVEVAGVLVGVIENGQFTRLLFDGRGTALGDDDGHLDAATPYGQRADHAARAAAIDYVRKGYDADMGVVRMGLRDYDPALGQFWTPDPLYMVEIERCAQSPVECNLYGYARNAPLDFVDPQGTDAAGWTVKETSREVTVWAKTETGKRVEAKAKNDPSSGTLDGAFKVRAPNGQSADAAGKGPRAQQSSELDIKATYEVKGKSPVHFAPFMGPVDVLIIVEVEYRGLIEKGVLQDLGLHHQHITRYAIMPDGGSVLLGGTTSPAERQISANMEDMGGAFDLTKLGTTQLSDGKVMKDGRMGGFTVGWGTVGGTVAPSPTGVTVGPDYAQVSVGGETTTQRTQDDAAFARTYVHVIPTGGNAWNK